MPARLPLSAAALLCVLAGAAAAQTAAPPLYKIVDPDGRVTYTDRPVPNAAGRVTAVGGDPAVVIDNPGGAPLPPALRAVAGRYPVTLYATPDCVPCDRGRELLRQRGIPYRERLATTDADREAWQRVTGANESPALAIGRQMLRGFSADAWAEYLDAAGYPRESALPPGYRPPPPTPIAEAKAVTPPSPAEEVLRENNPQPRLPLAPVEPPASGIRF